MSFDQMVARTEAAAVAVRSAPQFDRVRSGGTSSDARKRGTISAEGTVLKCEPGSGWLRGVFAGAMTRGSMWEGRLRRVADANIVDFFLCLGVPDENTKYDSANVLSHECGGSTKSSIRGTRHIDATMLHIATGGTLSWRSDGRAGALDACTDGGEMRRVFEGAIADEVYCGCFLGNAEVKLEAFHRTDVVPKPLHAPELLLPDVCNASVQSFRGRVTPGSRRVQRSPSLPWRHAQGCGGARMCSCVCPLRSSFASVCAFDVF
jgi:hypothetical protein